MDETKHDDDRQADYDPVWDTPPEVQALLDYMRNAPMDPESVRKRLIAMGVIDEQGNEILTKSYAKVSRADSRVYLDPPERRNGKRHR